MVSTLAMTDALSKLLIEKGVITDEEFKKKLGDRQHACTVGTNNAMASLLYKNHLILYIGNVDGITRTWTTDILIGWKTDPGWDFHPIKPTEQFDNQEEAEGFGLEAGKDWVDTRLWQKTL